jgi:hypothetical protein
MRPERKSISTFIKGYIVKLLIFLFPVLLFSCGKSPFTETEQPPGKIGGYQPLTSDIFLATEDINVSSYWRVGPVVGDECKLLVVMTDRENRPVSPSKKFNLMLWMPTMGHGSFPITVKETSTGVFEATELFFTMPGYWDIHFQLLDENNDVFDEVKWGMTL